MKKKYLVIGIVLLLICASLIVARLQLRTSQYVPLFSDNQVFFGMTPVEALSIMGTPDTVEHQICDTPDSSYVYSTSVMENDAEVECMYMRNLKLWQMNITWSLESAEAAAELHERIYTAVYERYSAQTTLSVDTESSDGGTITTLSISNGATGILYEVHTEGCNVRVHCINDGV